MNHATSIVSILLTLGIPLAAVLSNTASGVYGQQSTPSSPNGSSLGTISSAKLKAIMCDPSNPSLKVVNTTESRICGIPKTVKNTTTTTTAILPPTSAVSSSIMQTTKPTTTVTSASSPKQKQIATTNSNAVLRSNSAVTTGQVGVLENKSWSSSSSPSTIAPQLSAINEVQQQQKQQQMPIVSNRTTGLDSTLAPFSPPMASGQIMYLGYHGVSDTRADNSLKDNNHGSSETKSSAHNSNDNNKSPSKKVSQSKDHIHHNNNEVNKTKKGGSNGDSHKRSGGGGSIWDW
jgi:hypothetical protein